MHARFARGIATLTLTVTKYGNGKENGDEIEDCADDGDACFSGDDIQYTNMTMRMTRT